MAIYGVPRFSSTAEFLASVAARRGKLAKGGVPDRAGAARSVLSDWNGGKVPFYVLPPGFGEGGFAHAAAAGSAGGGAEEEEMAGDGASASSAASAVGRAGRGLRVSSSDVGSAAIVAEWAKVRRRARGLCARAHARARMDEREREKGRLEPLRRSTRTKTHAQVSNAAAPWPWGVKCV